MGHGLYSPYGRMRHECEPCLTNERNDAGPIEQQTLREVHLHVMPMDVINDERKRVQERKDEESVGDPSMKDLEPFVRYTCEECNPASLACSSTTHD